MNNPAPQLFTRNQHDWTCKLQRIADTVAALPVKSAWLDYEVVALMPNGTISFQALQNAFDTRSETNLVYYVFGGEESFELRPESRMFREYAVGTPVTIAVNREGEVIDIHVDQVSESPPSSLRHADTESALKGFRHLGEHE